MDAVYGIEDSVRFGRNWFAIESLLSVSYYCHIDRMWRSWLENILNRPRGEKGKMAKKAKKNDAIMTGILVTRFKMGLIDVEDLEHMAEDTSGSERSSAAKKVLGRIRDSAYSSPPIGEPPGI